MLLKISLCTDLKTANTPKGSGGIAAYWMGADGKSFADKGMLKIELASSQSGMGGIISLSNDFITIPELLKNESTDKISFFIQIPANTTIYSNAYANVVLTFIPTF